MNTFDSSDGRHASGLPTNSSTDHHPRALAEFRPDTPLHQRRRPPPSTPEILDALHRLVTAANLGHFNRPEGSRGRVEFEQAVQAAMAVLQRSNRYGEKGGGSA